MPSPANAINESTTGITGFTGTGFTGSPVTQYDVLVGGSTSSTLSGIANGTTGQVLTANTGAAPSWGSAASGGISTIDGDSGSMMGTTVTLSGGSTGLTTTASSATMDLTGTLAIGHGGSNATSFGTSQGVVVYNGSALVNYAGPQISSAGIATNTTQPALYAYLNASPSDVTGDGTNLTVIFDTVASENGANYNTSTGYFTAPVAGFYHIYTQITYYGLGAGNTQAGVYIESSGGDMLNSFFNPGAIASGGYLNTQASGLLNLAANETVHIVTYVDGATKTVGILGNDFGIYTYLNIFLVC